MFQFSGQNQQWVLASRPGPEGMVKENFRIEDIPSPSAEQLEDGEVLIKATMISVDPYMRGRMDDLKGKKSYFSAPFAIDEPPAGTVGALVVESKHANFSKGDSVQGFLPWIRLLTVNGDSLTKCDVTKIPLEKHMTVLNYSGMSAYLPIKHIGEPKAGETVFVSAAAGAVGSMACQILKQMGCKVVGSAGTAEKVDWLESCLGITAFNYKDEQPLAEQLSAACPDGIDIYFENVGGETLEVVLEQMNDFGRVIACGMISQYDLPFDERYGVKNLFYIVGKRLKFQGFIMSDWQGKPEWREAKAALLEMVSKDEVKTQETFVEGFEELPAAFLGLFTGSNQGKMLVRC